MPKRITLENHLDKKQLRRRYLTCQHPQEKMRWQALYLIAEGEIANQVAKKLGRCSGWITETARRYNESGAAGLKNKSKNQGSKTLTAEQVKELESEIESGKTSEQRLWSGAQIKRWVREKTNREIHKTTAWRMFARLNFSQQTARPQHKKRASQEEQREFKKT
ncbi:MAG: winged helix-turn-helix domain-containing protein [Acidobacteria bacterium]|nr:winged helix-turn-helix domain-containing protein [Acidobacteriota bacterium]MCA1640312.1 winged helix-turn-helix domain-containing protein [Acidobacteriota bacterium]